MNVYNMFQYKPSIVGYHDLGNRHLTSKESKGLCDSSCTQHGVEKEERGWVPKILMPWDNGGHGPVIPKYHIVGDMAMFMGMASWLENRNS